MLHIVTVYDSLNYGSFFQAHALQWELEKYGEVTFVDIHHQSTFKQTLKSCAKKFLKGKFQSMSLDYRNYKKFSEAKKTFSLTDISKIGSGKDDYFFFGSDEIWNISREKIKKSKEFFGYGFPEKNRISVAPSINRATIEQFKDNGYIEEELLKFKAISVRDMHTKEVIEQVVKKECSLVADPTLMHPKATYSKYQAKKKADNYIMLYTYGMMLNSELKKKIRSFADEKGLKIISVGRWFDFCDENVDALPSEFLSYVDNASYIFTDTFHGLMFSLIYEKQFLVFPCNNIKVEESLKILELQERLCMNGNISESLNNTIDYSLVTPRVKAFGNKTKEFLKNSVE